MPGALRRSAFPLEREALYARKGWLDRSRAAVIGRAAVVREGDDVTVVAVSMMVERALTAAE
ncbi:MAG TPA: transketolase C-terminal domain-containing protein, partial [Candidatus Dormibacteraeota bacterium]|nr:transketolase C-terminal domain-containing protein [Candidatus Dormibacteraeota bacterium]